MNEHINYLATVQGAGLGIQDVEMNRHASFLTEPWDTGAKRCRDS